MGRVKGSKAGAGRGSEAPPGSSQPLRVVQSSRGRRRFSIFGSGTLRVGCTHCRERSDGHGPVTWKEGDRPQDGDASRQFDSEGGGDPLRDGPLRSRGPERVAASRVLLPSRARETQPRRAAVGGRPARGAFRQGVPVATGLRRRVLHPVLSTCSLEPPGVIRGHRLSVHRPPSLCTRALPEASRARRFWPLVPEPGDPSTWTYVGEALAAARVGPRRGCPRAGVVCGDRYSTDRGQAVSTAAWDPSCEPSPRTQPSAAKPRARLHFSPMSFPWLFLEDKISWSETSP